MSHFVVLKLAALVFALVGVGMLAWAASEYRSASALTGDAIKADGTVIEMIKQEFSDPDAGLTYAYAPRIEFVDESGGTRNFIGNASNPPAYREGDHVEVIFQRSQPETARINSFMSLWLFPIVMAAFGLLFTLAGGAVLVSRRPPVAANP